MTDIAAIRALAPASTGAGAPAAAPEGGNDGGTMPPVPPIHAAAPGHGTREHSLAEPGPEARRPSVASADSRAPVRALMRQAEAVCRIANSRGLPDGGLPMPRQGWDLAQGALEVRGDLIRRVEGGYRIGAGQIWLSGQLVAAFNGDSLAFLDGGRTDRRV